MEQEEQITIENIIDELKSMNESSCFIIETKEETDKNEHIIKKEPSVRTQLSSKEKLFYKNVGDSMLSDVQNVIEEQIEAVSWMDKMKSAYEKTTNDISNVVDVGYGLFKNFFFPNGFSWIDIALTSILGLELVFLGFRKGIFRRVQQLKDSIKESYDWINNNIKLSPETKNRFGEIKGNLSEILEKMWEETKHLYEDIKLIFSNVYNALTSLTKEVFSETIDLGLYASDLISSLVLSVYGSIMSHFWNVVSEWGLSMMESIFGDSFKRHTTQKKEPSKKPKIEETRDKLSQGILEGNVKKARADMIRIRQQQEIEFAKHLTDTISPYYKTTGYEVIGEEDIVTTTTAVSTKGSNLYLVVAPEIILSSKPKENYGGIVPTISYNTKKEKSDFIAAINASYKTMKMLSFEEFKRLIPNENKTAENVKGMWDSYQQIMETRRLGMELYTNKIADDRNALLQHYLNYRQVKKFYTDTNVDIYYGDYNTGSAIEEDLSQLAKGNINLIEYLKETIKYFSDKNNWFNFQKTLSESLYENTSRFLSTPKPNISINDENDDIQVNNISAVNPSGVNELTNACRVVQLTEFQMEDALEKQENLLDDVYKKYDDFITAFSNF